MAQEHTIHVYLDWAGMDGPVKLGMLRSEMLRGKEVFSFESDQEWLRHPELRSLDPDLRQFSGVQYLYSGKQNFGLFLDSSPDRWGRVLMRRREAIRAKDENRNARTLTEADFLLGVSDESRMGALRFKTHPTGDYLDNDHRFATPPFTALRELEYASLQLENEATDDAEYRKWLNMLLAPGSSLGGARPKASVVNTDSSLWIAKFPSRYDTKNIGAWEAVAAQLATKCGIEISPFRARKLGDRHHTFLTQRFDRNALGKRLHFASALTLLGYTDGADSTSEASYLELALWIMQNCRETEKNLEQLWRRMVFNIAISNCDDHLRNHGFLLTKEGWTLSPAYDMNPEETGTGLKLNISENDNSLSFDLALSVAPYFRLTEKRAGEITTQIKNTVSGWSSVATQYKIPRSEQELIAPAFRYS